MEKAAVVDLPQAHALEKVYAGLGWDVSSSGDIDLDVRGLKIEPSALKPGVVAFSPLLLMVSSLRMSI